MLHPETLAEQLDTLNFFIDLYTLDAGDVD